MDGFEILTWLAAFAFMILGIGLPAKGRFGMQRESSLHTDAPIVTDDDLPPERVYESRT